MFNANDEPHQQLRRAVYAALGVDPADDPALDLTVTVDVRDEIPPKVPQRA